MDWLLNVKLNWVKKATLVATGGYCGLIANYLKRPFDIVNPILTLEGLRLIYQMNTNNKNRERIYEMHS